MRKFYEVDKTHKKHANAAIIPIRKTELSAGYDIALPIDIHLKPKEAKLVFTDIKAQMEHREFLMIVIRSSLAVKYRLSILNNVGIIDADYFNNLSNDGNIGLPLINNGKDDIKIPAGTPIVQGIFMEYKIVDQDTTKEVREGGFGSTTKE